MEQSNSKLKDLNFNLRRYIFNFLPYSDLITVYYSNKGLIQDAYANFKQILDAYLFLHKIMMMKYKECEKGEKWYRRGLKWIKYINYFLGVDIICFLLNKFPLFSNKIIIQALITFFTVFREKYKNNIILLKPESIQAHNHNHFYEIYSKVLPNLNKENFVYDVQVFTKSNELDEILSHVKYIHTFYTDLLENPKCDNFISLKFVNGGTAKFPNSIENLTIWNCEHNNNLGEFIKDPQSAIQTIWIEQMDEYLGNIFNGNMKLHNMASGDMNNMLKFPENLIRIYNGRDDVINTISGKKGPFPNLKEIGGITLTSKKNKTEFLKFISINNNITKITNLKFDSTKCSFIDLIHKLSILNLKVLSLKIEETNPWDENELEVAFELIKNSFKNLKLFELKFWSCTNKFKIDSVIDIQNTGIIPFDLIVHLLKNNTKLPFYHISVDYLEIFNKFLNYLEINKEFQILKKIKGLEYLKSGNEKKTKSLKINHSLKLYRLSLNNYKDLNKFKSIETLRLDLKSIPTIEIIKKINTKKLLSLSIDSQYKAKELKKLIDLMNYFVDNYEKEFNQVVHLHINRNLVNRDEWKGAKFTKKLENILLHCIYENEYSPTNN